MAIPDGVKKKDFYEKSLRLAYLKAVRDWQARSDIPGGCFTVAQELAKQALKAAQMHLQAKKSSQTSEEASLLAAHLAKQANMLGQSFKCDAWAKFLTVCEELV